MFRYQQAVCWIKNEIEPEAWYVHEPSKNASSDEHPGPPFVLLRRIRKPRTAVDAKAMYQKMTSSAPLLLVAGVNLCVGLG
jgi:hypothetical protein